MKRKSIFLIALVLAVALSSAASAAMPTPYELIKDGAVKAKSLAVVPAKAALFLGSDGVGDSVTAKAVAKPAAASQVFSWTSLNTSVATVDEAGVITAAGLGKTRIICSTTDLSNLKKAVTVTVKPVKVQNVTLGETALTIAPNTAKRLTYTLSPENAYDKTVKWISSNPNVATVDENGLVRAKKLGSCVITCKSLSSGVAAKARITVSRAASDVYYLAIGQQNYIRADSLIGCKMDADRFAATVGASTFGGSSTPVGKVFYDQTAPQIKAALNGVSTWGMDENDVTYVFYSGHGAGSTGFEGALVGVEYDGVETMEATCVKVSDIRSFLDKVPGTVIVVVDACHSGNFVTAKSTGSGDFAQAFVKAFSSNANAKSLIDENELKDKYKIMVACRPEEQSYMIGNGFGSVFTRFMTQAGGVWGADTGDITVKAKMAADANSDKTVTLKEAFAYVYPRALKAVKKMSRNSVVQRMMVWPTADNYPVFARLS